MGDLKGLYCLDCTLRAKASFGEVIAVWEGNSGAAVVCDGLVVAVQMQHQNPKRPALLEASLLETIYTDRQWCALLEQQGINPESAIARLKAEGASLQSSIPYFYPHNLGSTTFVGRGDELQQLHQLLQSSERVASAAAVGMGGIEKTELAWQYVDQHTTAYPGGIWWTAPAERVVQILSYGRRMRLAEAPDTLQSDEERVQWYYTRWVEAIPEGLRLVVLDDVSSYGEVRSLLATDQRFRVLLTTREKLGKPVQRFVTGSIETGTGVSVIAAISRR